jgi:hypothetical protein
MEERIPVLVVHGVNTRNPIGLDTDTQNNRVPFEERVKHFNELVGNRWHFFPVYWGDLGVHVDDLAQILPPLEEKRDSILHFIGSWAWHESIVQATTATKATVGIAQILGSWLLGNQRKASELIEQTTTIIDDFDHCRRSFYWELSYLFRKKMIPAVIPFIGDILLYQTVNRQKLIQQRLLEKLAEIQKVTGQPFGTPDLPISIIAHSLGGVIAFDLALTPNPKIYINRLITMGSQPSLFYLVDSHRYTHHSKTADGTRLQLPQSIMKWTNIIDPLDPLSFSVNKVFAFSDGTNPQDIILGNDAGHAGYWTSKEVIKEIQDALVD